MIDEEKEKESKMKMINDYMTSSSSDDKFFMYYKELMLWKQVMARNLKAKHPDGLILAAAGESVWAECSEELRLGAVASAGPPPCVLCSALLAEVVEEVVLDVSARSGSEPPRKAPKLGVPPPDDAVLQRNIQRCQRLLAPNASKPQGGKKSKKQKKAGSPLPRKNGKFVTS